jgi:Uma2 family endonuclease
MLAAETVKLSAEEYLAGEETAGIKHEFLDGEVWAMVGASDNHVTIAGSLFTLLKRHLKNSPCRAYISDMKVRVEKADAFFYPDVLVTFEAKDRNNTHFKEYSVFIAEVLSPSTEGFDRGSKFNAYRQLDSLQTYWLIDTENNRIDSFTRADNDDWLLHSYTQAEGEVEINHLAFRCLLNDIYEDVLPDDATH